MQDAECGEEMKQSNGVKGNKIYYIHVRSCQRIHKGLVNNC